MAKKKSAAPKHVEPEDISQEEPEEEPEADEESTGKSISKAEAVRQALAAGNDSPEDGVGYLKSIHGIEMTRQMFSSYKAQEKARQAKKGGAPKGKPGRKPRQVAETGQVAAASKPVIGKDSDMIENLAAVKHLVQKLGADQVRKIVGLFE